MNPKNDLLTNLPTENTAPQSLPWHGGMIGMMLFCILLLSITGCVTTLDPNATPAAVATPDAAIPRPGLGSLGDPYYPWMGNSGYDAMHYTIDLTVDSVAPDSVDPPTTTISSTVTMEATALQPLSTFNLDFLGFEIDQLTVNGTPADFSRTDRELLIIPATPLAWGEPFSVTVAYQGVPEPAPDPALGIAGVGWLTTPGGIYVFSQPSGASSWFPVNDYPQDKASYTFRVTVPEPYTVVANGILQETTTGAGQSTYLWEATDPMASYLATINIGKFARQTDTGPNGLPIRNYFPIDASAAITLPFAATAEQLAFFSERFGPYPFAVYGSLVMAVDFPAALETQTIPVYGRSIVGAQGERVLAHEMAHQWIGDYVSVETWQDIWINEGFATYADWLWVEESQGEAAMQALIRDAYRLFATPNPQEEFPKQPLVARLQSLPLEGLTLAPEQVAIVLSAFLGTTVATDELGAAVADLPAAGLPGTELPALIDEIPFDVATFSPQQLVTALEALELDEIAASVVVTYPPPGAPPINQLFGASVYERGGLTFAALHARLGDETFFEVMRTYIERYGGGVAGTDELIGVAEAVSGQELTDFFYGWLFAEELPDIPELGLIRDDPTTWQEHVTQEQE